MTATDSPVLARPGERVLFVVPAIGNGGAELQALQQIAGLERRGVSVSLLILSSISDPEVLGRVALPANRVCVLPGSEKILSGRFLARMPQALCRAARFVSSQDCRKVIALLPPAHVHARLLKLAMLARGRSLLLFQYHHSEENRLNPRDSVAKWLFSWINQLLSKFCDHAHWYVSERVRADIAGVTATRSDAVLYNTCDMDSTGDPAAAQGLLAPLLGETKPFLILLPGRLLTRKGHALLLRAAARLIAEYGLTPADIRILFAGDGPDRGAVETVTVEIGLGDHVVMLGSVPHPTLLALYGMVDLVVVPSLVEGFGIVAIEALSRGALLIASDAAGLDEIVQPGVNALQFPVGDEAALAERLAEVWRCRGQGLIDRGALPAEMAERFGLDRHLDRMLALLDGGAG